MATAEFRALLTFVEKERARGTVHPPEADVFNAFAHTPFAKTRVVILGQDPYHGPGQAHGLSFSVRPGVSAPPSLKNMFKELHTDLGIPIPTHGSLAHWADQGVLLLNTVLTVREGEANSHQAKGWERFTDAAIGALNDRTAPVVFVLWGKSAQKKAALITGPQHSVLLGTHPSPLSAHSGFFGSKPFSRINAFLKKNGSAPIDWALTP